MIQIINSLSVKKSYHQTPANLQTDTHIIYKKVFFNYSLLKITFEIWENCRCWRENNIEKRNKFKLLFLSVMSSYFNEMVYIRFLQYLILGDH